MVYPPWTPLEVGGQGIPDGVGVHIGADGVGAWESQYAPPGASTGEEPNIRAAGGADKNFYEEDAGKYCGTKDTGRNCCVGVLCCCPKETPVIMCGEPRYPNKEEDTGSQITLLFRFFLHTTSL